MLNPFLELNPMIVLLSMASSKCGVHIVSALAQSDGGVHLATSRISNGMCQHCYRGVQ